jgi:large subunit ribosomal protein L32
MKAPAMGKCSNCKSVTMLHHVCPECGYYRGKQAIEKEIV